MNKSVRRCLFGRPDPSDLELAVQLSEENEVQRARDLYNVDLIRLAATVEAVRESAAPSTDDSADGVAETESTENEESISEQQEPAEETDGRDDPKNSQPNQEETE